MSALLLLIAGLPRSGKTALADALSAAAGLTHVPLDRYIQPNPAGTTFLEWVASPACINWPLLGQTFDELAAGRTLSAPADWGPSWGDGGQQIREAGSGRERVLVPSDVGYAVPGCYAFDFALPNARCVRVFVQTPRRVIAERVMGRAIRVEDVDRVLDQQLSPNWREIEQLGGCADIVVSGTALHEEQVKALARAIEG